MVNIKHIYPTLALVSLPLWSKMKSVISPKSEVHLDTLLNWDMNYLFKIRFTLLKGGCLNQGYFSTFLL